MRYAQMKGGDDEGAPPGGWLVVACFHTLWSSKSISLIPALTDIIPTFQDRVSFISVRADGEGLESVAKKLKIIQFPTLLILRGGKELERIGDKNTISKLIAFLNQTITREDKVASILRRESQLAELPTDVVDEPMDLEENVDLGWTWDSEKSGKEMTLSEDGRTVVLTEVAEEISAVWETVDPRGWNWSPTSAAVNSDLERQYRRGVLYSGNYGGPGFMVQIGPIEITSYVVKGFHIFFLERGVTGRPVNLRRRGERVRVPGEEAFLTDEQRERDQADMEWQQQRQEKMKKLKEESYGHDNQAIRASCSVSRFGGAREWSVKWTHDPPRGGRGDGIGLCIEDFEAFGPVLFPCLGGTNDSGEGI